MIIFLYGDDSYERNNRKKFIINEFLRKNSSWGLGYFDFSKEGSEKELVQFFSQTALFGGKKLAVIEDLDIKEHKKFLKNNLESIGSILVTFSGRPTKDFKFLLEDPVIREEFRVLEGSEWETYLAKKAKGLGLHISPRALKFIANVFMKDTWGAVTELEKLSSLSKKEIDIGDMTNLDIQSNPDFFGTLQRLKGRTLRERLWAYQTLSLNNEPAGKTFNVISSFWYEKSARFADYDVKAKSGKIEYEEALLDIVLS